MTKHGYVGPGRYRHYKGGYYNVLGLGLREETVVKFGRDLPNEEVTCVIYEPLTEGSMLEDREERFWIRALDDFNEMVTVPVEQGGQEDDVTQVPRFQKVDDYEF